jgi:hypothetical protein
MNNRVQFKELPDGRVDSTKLLIDYAENYRAPTLET